MICSSVHKCLETKAFHSASAHRWGKWCTLKRGRAIHRHRKCHLDMSFAGRALCQRGRRNRGDRQWGRPWPRGSTSRADTECTRWQTTSCCRHRGSGSRQGTPAASTGPSPLDKSTHRGSGSGPQFQSSCRRNKTLQSKEEGLGLRVSGGGV